MTESKHSIENVYAEGGFVFTDSGLRIADCYCDDQSMPAAEIEANARRIALAWNCHNVLVEVLRSCAAFLYAWGQDPPANNAIRLNAFRDQAEFARAALAKAKGEA